MRGMLIIFVGDDAVNVVDNFEDDVEDVLGDFEDDLDDVNDDVDGNLAAMSRWMKWFSSR